MTGSAEAWRSGAAALSDAFRRGALDPRDVLGAVLDRHAALNPRLNATVLRDDTAAHEAAARSAARWRAGTPLSPLDGVPVTVKDNIPVAGLRCTWGSPLFADHIASGDEIAVERLRAAGAVLWAKTNTPELAMAGITENPVFGTTRNPWDLTRTPGGSSGGGAALVAAGVGPLALATDAAGSIRRPACYCGVIGVRPSTGLVARLPGTEGVAFPPLAADYQVLGPIARSVADAALMLHVIAGPDPRDRASLGHARPPARPAPLLRRPRVGLIAAIAGHPCDQAEQAAAEAAAEALRRHGAEVQDVAPFWDPDDVNAVFGTIASVGVARVVRRHAGWEARVTPIIRGMAEAGLAIPGSAYLDALDRVAALRHACAAAFAEVDAILTPASATLPWAIGRTFPETIGGLAAGPRAGGVFSVVVNMAGLPAVALPGPPSPDGLPAGVQIIGPFGSDAALLSLASVLEHAMWPDGLPRPPGFA
jgi:aspartyl-tRNA(Asn)/glutamyl-tRNA(Gln) amidotransferase subunit A